MYRNPPYRKHNSFLEQPESYPRDGMRFGKTANLQEIFLNNCRKNENVVVVETIQGEKTLGKIIGFDSHSVILSNNDNQSLIYKTAISSITPEQPVQYIFNELQRRNFTDLLESDIPWEMEVERMEENLPPENN